MVLLLALLLGQGLTGIVDNDDVADAGPLTGIMPAPVANLIDRPHTWLRDALLAEVALHMMAIAVYAAAKGQNLLLPMLTGRKRLPTSAKAPGQASAGLALLVPGSSAAATAPLPSTCKAGSYQDSLIRTCVPIHACRWT